MNIARIQRLIARHEKSLVAMQARHDFIANVSIKQKYAHEIAARKRELDAMKQQLEHTLILEPLTRK